MIATLLTVALLSGAAGTGPKLALAPKAKPAAAAKAKPAGKAPAKAKPKQKAHAAAEHAVTLTSDPVVDPLAPASGGRMQCYNPDTIKHTCASLAEFADNGDGTWSNISSVLINSAPPVVLKTITPVTVKDSAICGQIRPEDITAGTLTVSGAVLSPADAEPILANIGQAMIKLYGHEICTRFYANGIDYTAKVTMDGEPNGMPDNEVLWVGPKDGYIVAPKG